MKSKKKTNKKSHCIRIDDAIWKKARKSGLNISAFVEKKLTQYLGGK